MTSRPNVIKLKTSPKPVFLYLIRVLTYGTYHPIKIGLANNVLARVRQLRREVGIACPQLIGCFEFADRKIAQEAETSARHHFPHCPRYADNSREILKADAAEIEQFIWQFRPSKFLRIKDGSRWAS